jgi:hypothetical protein
VEYTRHPRSHADIVWCVVDYTLGDDAEYHLRVLGTYTTTLEEAVVGLTAGNARPKPDFERSLLNKLGEEAH